MDFNPYYDVLRHMGLNHSTCDGVSTARDILAKGSQSLSLRWHGLNSNQKTYALAAVVARGSSSNFKTSSDIFSGLFEKYSNKENGSFLLENGVSILSIAINCNNEEMALLLIDAGAPLTQPNTEFVQPLALALISAQKKVAFKMLEKDSNLASFEALDAAVTNGYEDMVEVILKQGVSPNLQTSSPAGPTPVHLAAQLGDEKAFILTLLADYGADLDAFDKFGDKPGERGWVQYQTGKPNPQLEIERLRRALQKESKLNPPPAQTLSIPRL